jgi:putative cardiolipin synthase
MGLNFIDNDAFAIGWIIEPLQGLFDRYWNADAVYPLQTVARSVTSPENLRRQFEEWTGPAQTPPPGPVPAADILGYGPLARELDRGRLDLIWAEAFAFADHPDKPFDGEVGGQLQNTSVTFNLFEAIRKARQEVVLSSPYLVPGEVGMDLLRELRSRGVAVTALTNSLGSTDEPLVHVGYTKYRNQMLAMGIDIYEVSGSRVKRNRSENLFGASLGRLHAKLAVIDRRWLFVGSKNLDPRSATINTELGVVIDSPALARELLKVIEIDRLQNAYKLRLSPETGECQWLGTEDDKELVLSEEPDSTFWLRMKLRLLRPFVPESLL